VPTVTTAGARDGSVDAYDLLAPDNRGTGGSGMLDGTLSVEAMAGDALAVLDDAGVGRAHVVGHSLGGLIAQHVALSARDRVMSLARALRATFGRRRLVSSATMTRPLEGVRS